MSFNFTAPALELDEGFEAGPLQPDKTVIIEPTGKHTHTLIYLHGYSLSGRYEKNWFFDYYNVTHPNLKIVALTAKKRYEPTQGRKYNSWFRYTKLLNYTALKIEFNDLIGKGKDR
jgi:hypothetical protein